MYLEIETTTCHPRNFVDLRQRSESEFQKKRTSTRCYFKNCQKSKNFSETVFFLEHESALREEGLERERERERERENVQVEELCSNVNQDNETNKFRRRRPSQPWFHRFAVASRPGTRTHPKKVYRQV